MAVDRSSLSEADLVALAAEVDTHRGLRDVLAWAASRSSGDLHPQIVADVITQDEFTHDVIVPYRDVFLVYDTT